jgi:uncharacterized protein YycO
LIISRKTYQLKQIDYSKLKQGDVLLFGSNSNLHSFPIKIANILTNNMVSKPWTHAAIYTGEGKLIEAQSAGVLDNTIDYYIEHDRLVKVCRHKYIKDPAFFDQVVKFCRQMQQEGYKYDYLGLLFYTVSVSLPRTWDWLILDNILVDRWLDLDKAYFCSELVADAYKESGAPVASYHSWRVKPSDFITNPMFEDVDVSTETS